MTTLTEDIVRFQETGEGYQKIVDRISLLVYRFPTRRQGFTEEDCAEFLLRFHPRISGLVDRFTPAGFPFESYLQSTLKWQIKSFASARTRGKVHLYAGRSNDIAASMHPSLCHERKDPYGSDYPRAHTVPEAPVQITAKDAPDAGRGYSALKSCLARRLAMIALKASEHLDEGAYRQLAHTLGCSGDWLVERWQEVRESCVDQRLRRDRYREMRDKTWFRIRCLQMQRRNATDDDERARVDERLACCKRRLERARQLLARMPSGPTHQQIALALGIPKGTVDSGIHYAKREIDERSLAKVVAHFANST